MRTEVMQARLYDHETGIFVQAFSEHILLYKCDIFTFSYSRIWSSPATFTYYTTL